MIYKPQKPEVAYQQIAPQSDPAQSFSLLPTTPVDFSSLQMQPGTPFMLDASGLGPQIDPTTVAAGYGRKTPKLARPDIYGGAAGYQPNLTQGNGGFSNG